ncbi:hypothetical protein RAD15_34440 [Bradyrhizobium sp. 14AA]
MPNQIDITIRKEFAMTAPPPAFRGDNAERGREFRFQGSRPTIAAAHILVTDELINEAGTEPRA